MLSGTYGETDKWFQRWHVPKDRYYLTVFLYHALWAKNSQTWAHSADIWRSLLCPWATFCSLSKPNCSNLPWPCFTFTFALPTRLCVAYFQHTSAEHHMNVIFFSFFHHILTSWSRAHLEKPVVPHMGKKFPASYGSRCSLSCSFVFILHFLFIPPFFHSFTHSLLVFCFFLRNYDYADKVTSIMSNANRRTDPIGQRRSQTLTVARGLLVKYGPNIHAVELCLILSCNMWL